MQLLKTNPELSKNELIKYVARRLQKESAALTNARICDAVNRTDEAQAIVEQFMLRTDLDLAGLQVEYGATAAPAIQSNNNRDADKIKRKKKVEENIRLLDNEDDLMCE